MGQTSIKDTILGQSIIGYQLKTKIPYSYHTEGKRNYLSCHNSVNNNYKILLPPLTLKVTDIVMQKGLGDIYLYLEVMLETYDTKALIMITPHQGLDCERIKERTNEWFIDPEYYGTYDVNKPIHIKRDMLEII